jgi:hypothetical protein
MKLTFTTQEPAGSLDFESCYEEELQLDPEEKAEILAAPEQTLCLWMFVDGELAGETYGASPHDLFAAIEEEIEDCDKNDPLAVYCYSTTILPKFQGMGLAKILKAYWLGLIKGRGYDSVCGHATTPAMLKINLDFGAQVKAVHSNWYETERTAHFYEIKL